MADGTSIEWTDASWTPIRARNKATGEVGWHCEHATTGCEFCYAEGFNARLGTGLPFKPGHRKDIEIFLDEEMLTQPLRWKKPRRIFVCSMTDLFADFVPDEWIDKMFAVMALAPQHTFQVLTKRAKRMREYLNDPKVARRIYELACDITVDMELQVVLIAPGADERMAPAGPRIFLGQWPLPNVWLGVSAEDQPRADERIPELLQTPAAVRFISAEPLLGPIDLEPWLEWHDGRYIGDNYWGCVGCDDGCSKCPNSKAVFAHSEGPLDAEGCPEWVTADRVVLDWIIVGGESGPSARPMHHDWARWLRDQCVAAGVAFFFKQWGEWAPGENANFAMTRSERVALLMSDNETPVHWSFGTVTPRESEETHRDDAPDLYRIGKKRAGRKLDGVEHSEFPS